MSITRSDFSCESQSKESFVLSFAEEDLPLKIRLHPIYFKMKDTLRLFRDEKEAFSWVVHGNSHWQPKTTDNEQHPPLFIRNSLSEQQLHNSLHLLFLEQRWLPASFSLSLSLCLSRWWQSTKIVVLSCHLNRHHYFLTQGLLLSSSGLCWVSAWREVAGDDVTRIR